MEPRERRTLTYLLLAVFLSSFDRLSITPLLLLVAADMGVQLATVTSMVTVYLVAYGLMQVVWGIISDRLGRLRTLALALAIAGAASVLTALAPNIAVLTVARVVAGGAFAAIVPGALIWAGDTFPPARRHGPLTDIMSSTALGMAAATLVAAAMGDLLGWRSVFGLTAVAVLVTALVLFRQPSPRPDVEISRRFWKPILQTLRHRWSLVVLFLAFSEGVFFLGVLTFLPTVLQQGGLSTANSGLVTASYGLAIIGFAALVKRLSRKRSITWLVLIGALMAVGAYIAMAVDQWVPGILIGSTLLAGAWAFMHSSMQHWATQVRPEARATVVSLFASMLFLGSSAGTAIGTVFVVPGDAQTGFAWGVAGTVLLAVVAVVARRTYEARDRT